MTFELILLAWLILAAALGFLAKQRGRGWLTWFLIGAMLTPLLGFVLLMMKKTLAPSVASNTITYDLDMTHLQCPNCSEYVIPEATVCPYCGHHLEPNLALIEQRLAQKTAEEAELQRGRQLNFILAISVAVVIGVLAWLVTVFS